MPAAWGNTIHIIWQRPVLTLLLPSCAGLRFAGLTMASLSQYYKESEEWNSSLLHRTEQLPARCISYSPSGSMMAVVGDNFNVTHISLAAGSKVRLRPYRCVQRPVEA